MYLCVTGIGLFFDGREEKPEIRCNEETTKNVIEERKSMVQRRIDQITGFGLVYR